MDAKSMMKSSRVLITGLALSLVGLFAGASAAAEAPIGEVKTANGSVSILRSSGSIDATVGQKVEAADVVRTGPDGTVGITFVDETMMSLGPNSELALEKFRFDTTTHDGAFETSVRRGTLSVISGKITKQSPDAVKVKTPRSILGVRGTFFLVKVEE